MIRSILSRYGLGTHAFTDADAVFAFSLGGIRP